MLYLIFACLQASIPWLTLELTSLNFCDKAIADQDPDL